MPDTTATTPTRVRVSAYQARIERSLTDHYFEVPEATQAGEEWILESVAHTNGYASCELCGHTPIKRLFFIRNRTTQDQKMIGSECARNYVRVNLVDAYLRTLTRAQNRVRNQNRRSERQAQFEANRRRIQEARAAERATWRSQNDDVISFVHANCTAGTFLDSMATSLEQYGSLTANQTATVRRIMAERSTPRPQNAADRAASPDQVPHIYNGTYTMDDGLTHMTYQIYTATRGPLRGKRIVKKQNQYMAFEGFAFVGQNGELVVWRRYAEQAARNELFIVWARVLLNILNVGTVSTPGVDELERTGTWEGTGYTSFTIQRTRSCRRCNRPLTVPTSIESGIGPECQRRDHERTTAANQHATVETPATGPGLSVRAPHPYNATCGCTPCYRERMNRSAAERAARVAERAARVAQESTQLVLSELGTGMPQ